MVDPAAVMHLLNDAIIQELLDRVKALEDRVAALENK